jgi:excisionase family DNA binding protein
MTEKTTTHLARRKAEREPTPIPPLLLTPREAAGVLRISERLLWELTDRGDIASVRIHRLVRYSPADLQAWIEHSKIEREAQSDGQHQHEQA